MICFWEEDIKTVCVSLIGESKLAQYFDIEIDPPPIWLIGLEVRGFQHTKVITPKG